MIYLRIYFAGIIANLVYNVGAAILRAVGDSKRPLYFLAASCLVNIALDILLVVFCRLGVVGAALATILSQLFLLAAAVRNMNQKDNAFGFSMKAVSLKPAVTFPMIGLSIPVIAEKMAFSFGKVIINSMSTIYSALTVGALGISNNIGGITTMPQNGFQEGGSAIISQSVGAGKPRRALKAFGCVLAINLVIGIVLMSCSLYFLDALSRLFAGNDPSFQKMIISIYRFEALGAIPLGVTASVMALLYGFGKTKLTLAINFCRVFVFRVPVLWFLQSFTSMGSLSVGVVMAVSNIATGVFALIIGVYEIVRICRRYEIPLSAPFPFSGFQKAWGKS